MVMVETVGDAKAAENAGADSIVAQGSEAGGHRSRWRRSPDVAVGTLALVPEIVDAVRVPVIAAGGIADGRGLAAALALGAAGVLMGTRFVATKESMAPDFWKRRIVESASDATIVTAAFTGLPAREQFRLPAALCRSKRRIDRRSSARVRSGGSDHARSSRDARMNQHRAQRDNRDRRRSLITFVRSS